MLRRLVAPLAAIIVLAVPATAQAAIVISFIRYNHAGPDTTAKLNKEYVTVHNNGRLAKALAGWRLHDQSHHRFTFPNFSLCGGCSVCIHTGNGTNGTANLYWGSGAFIWNNTGDKATLVKKDGVIRDTCAYKGTSLGYRCADPPRRGSCRGAPFGLGFRRGGLRDSDHAGRALERVSAWRADGDRSAGRPSPCRQRPADRFYRRGAGDGVDGRRRSQTTPVTRAAKHRHLSGVAGRV